MIRGRIEFKGSAAAEDKLTIGWHQYTVTLARRLTRFESSWGRIVVGGDNISFLAGAKPAL